MSDQAGRNGGQDQRQTGPGSEVRWDTSAMRSQFCDVATITQGAGEVELNFGVIRSGEGASAELAVELQRRVALRPMTAKNLRDMLRNLIAEIDARASDGSS